MAMSPPAPFDTVGYLFNQCLPLMLLFSMSCPSPSLLNTYRFIWAPQLCQALPQPHIPSLGGSTSHAFGSVWLVSGPVASATSLLPPFPFPSLPLLPHCIPSLCLCWGGRGDSGEPVPWCSLEHPSLLSILLLWCLLPSLCPTCSPGELARCLAPCPLLTDSHHLQNSFFLLDINFFTLFFSLSLSLSCSSLSTALLLTQGKCFFSFPLVALALFLSVLVRSSLLVFVL